jgi:hypothetical protein
MYMFNAQSRSRSFPWFAETTVAQALRNNMRNGFEDFVKGYKYPGDVIGQQLST